VSIFSAAFFSGRLLSWVSHLSQRILLVHPLPSVEHN
jgi:hypothetical protein